MNTPVKRVDSPQKCIDIIRGILKSIDRTSEINIILKDEEAVIVTITRSCEQSNTIPVKRL